MCIDTIQVCKYAQIEKKRKISKFPHMVSTHKVMDYPLLAGLQYNIETIVGKWKRGPISLQRSIVMA